jgi:hypothetical protein
MDNNNDLEFNFLLCHGFGNEITQTTNVDDDEYKYYRYCLCQRK